MYQGQGLRVEKHREGRARPDAVLVPEGHFAGHGEWAEPSGVLLVLEVTSHGSDLDSDLRDRQEKPVAYGAAGIPLYLLIDRDACTVTLHGDPDPGVGYRSSRKESFGAALLLPDPLGIELDTEKLKQYVD
ncbi:Uma2 family endonuclease [Streptomyces griseorubiginosus]|uniref:Uma2 family endonuclease n=1 Tax=Streptomyces griseorubiginosus TaxID=67304 RepID=UPI00364B4B75